MRFFADLHIHSKYSRATSRDCDLEHLALWARRKGIAVLGSGDFTHPAWIAALAEQTVEAEPGLRRLKPELERQVSEGLGVPGMAPGAGEPVRFMLTVEISTIYKKGDCTRKVHHVIGVPSLEAARRLIARLGRIGNLNADGRPILGLDSRDLLEITLEADPDAFLIPAHIWTPWFSALGSKSGFDSIEACYGDLSEHIFAVETGLSSDPPMNWRVGRLDRYRLVSNSDAHSPAKVAREATVFTSAVDYFAMVRALKTGEGYGGTVEFFPEEGKYHLDGHRACQVCLDPVETRRLSGICPVCGKGLTVGVLNRVEELADRPEGIAAPRAAPFWSLIPLPEIIGEVEGVGPASGRVTRSYDEMLRRLGPELFILESVPLEEIRRHISLRMAEAIGRVRAGEVIRSGGYDGEFGVIRVFAAKEARPKKEVGALFAPGSVEETVVARKKPVSAGRGQSADAVLPAQAGISSGPGEREVPAAHGLESAEPGVVSAHGLDPEQERAAAHGRGPLLILAGPGTGKTRTLTHRLARLVQDGGEPEASLAVTFTRRAAEEMRERLAVLLGEDLARRIPVMTFHALGWAIFRQYGTRFGYPPTVSIAGEVEAARRLQEDLGVSRSEAGKVLEGFSRARRGAGCGTPEEEASQSVSLAFHREGMRKRGLVELEDLVALPVAWMNAAPELVEELRARYRRLFVDEFQDIDATQYALLRHLVVADGDLCVIGDPDQSIYGFRGGDPRFFAAMARDFPAIRTVRLTRNYRSGRAIVQGALGVMERASERRERALTPILEDARRIVVHTSASEHAEAEFVVRTLEAMMGGHGFHAMDSGQADGHAVGEYAFSDFAVLYRSDALSVPVCQALERAGIPYQKRSHNRLRDHAGVKALLESMGRVAGGGSVGERLKQAAALAGEDPEVRLALEWLAPLAERHGDDEPGFVSAVALGAEVDWLDPRAQRVSLLTLHGSKGLEYRVVFVIGCEEGMLPWRFGGTEAGEREIEEERRLLFVAMTRARETLFLSWAKKRLWRGVARVMEISSFLQGIREEWLERRVTRAVAPKKSVAGGKQLTLLWE
ncbi:MAG: UvrD-helicase domain-containing protein [Magnetococcales bacterium]|nr:UvrD-helicase domain-containing protein [Magnetococcales bacterium]